MSTFKVQGQVHVYHLAGSLLPQKPEAARFMEQADRRRFIGLISAVNESSFGIAVLHSFQSCLKLCYKRRHAWLIR